MTEEQIEKETKSYGVDLCAYCRECDNGEEKPCQHKIDAMHGYKDGLKAGYHEGFKDCAKAKLNVTTISDCPIKYEWHDLRKNPKDLPTEDCKDYLAIGLDDTEPSIYMYLAGDDETEGQWEWEPRRIACLSNDQIKAWCEIPTFEENA